MFVSGAELYQWRQQAVAEAIAADVSPQEVDWLLQKVTKLHKLALRLGSYQQENQIQLEKSWTELTHLWQKRLKERVPIQYLVGVTNWRHFSLKVTPDVLIPRPETECLIDLALEVIKISKNPDLSSGNWVDLGTGSGAIALGLAEVLTQATIYAIDRSVAALAIAQENALSLGFIDTIKFKQGSWWSPLENLQGQISGMVSNPPYIPRESISQLQAEVTCHEPHLALDGGENGLEHIQYLVETAPLYLVSGGIWLIEMMAGQSQIVKGMLQNQGSYENIQIFNDLAGIERFALAYRK